jgi:hypothetical protein
VKGAGAIGGGLFLSGVDGDVLEQLHRTRRVDMRTRSFRSKEAPPVDANRELVALGAANLGGGLFQAYPAGGGLSQTAVNDRAGARSRLASLVTAGAARRTFAISSSSSTQPGRRPACCYSTSRPCRTRT